MVLDRPKVKQQSSSRLDFGFILDWPIIRNSRGQSAILVAMLFNVLFVFFAMSINVALVVHDKINLQNAVDLAAYYAASKQAEILNVIAHENYMIRQSWKLLSWRYRVLGTLGLYRGGNIHPARSGDLSDTAFDAAKTPAVCITYFPNWKEVPPDENLCNEVELKIPPLPHVQVIAGFLNLNHGIAALSEQLIAQFNAECVKHGAFNWWFAMSILHAFRIDQRNRMQIIQALANNLSNGQNGDFIDLDGKSVLEGAKQTFEKNLTETNRTGANLTLVNGLQGHQPSEWLPKVVIAPMMIYTDIDNSNGCNAISTPVSSLPREQAAYTILQGNWPAGLQAGDLFQFKDLQVDPQSDWTFTMGVEKNPWIVAYMGATGSSQGREIFFPLAGGVDMKAHGFAKPFGGRIGPWYGNRWDPGSPMSTGDPVDALIPPRAGGDGGIDDQDPRRLPNYSRYPGDQLGVTSKLAQGAIGNLLSFKESYASLLNIKADFQAGADNDILTWGGQAGDLRNMEIAALSPDLFDIAYYSIEPDFTRNYLTRLQANAAALGIGSDVVIRPDLGFNSNGIPQYSVQQQMGFTAQRQLQNAQAYYFVRNRFHLLTGWLPAPGAFNYNWDQAKQNFGACKVTDDGVFANPGSCIAGGGRTGYSTKMVSRDFLLSPDLPLAGPNSGSGSATNPPE